MKLLRETIRQILLEEFIGSGRQAYIYHGSKSPPEEMIPILLKDKWRPRSGNDGLYFVTDLDASADGTSGGYYGKWLYKIKVNLYGFLITELDIAKKVYGDNFMPSDQVMLITGDEKVYKQVKKDEIAYFEEKKIHPGIQLGAFIGDQLVGKLFKGVLFDTGIGVVYDYEKLVPISFKKLNDKDWTRVPMEDLRQVKSKIAKVSSTDTNRKGEFDRSTYDFLQNL